MKFYEVIIELLNGCGKSIGRTSKQLKAKSRFDAAVKAEQLTDFEYGESICSHALKVQQIKKCELVNGRLAA